MTTPAAAASVEALLARAREAHESILREPASALRRAFEAGDALLGAKARVAHGAWTAALRRTTIPPSTAQLYMQLARARARILAAGCTSIREARRLLSGTKPRPGRPRRGRSPGRAAADRYDAGYADGYRAGRADGIATAQAHAWSRRQRAAPLPLDKKDVRWLIKLAHPDQHDGLLRATRVTQWLNEMLARAATTD